MADASSALHDFSINVLPRLKLSPSEVLGAYVVGSRLYGTARKSSDHDLVRMNYYNFGAFLPPKFSL